MQIDWNKTCGLKKVHYVCPKCGNEFKKSLQRMLKKFNLDIERIEKGIKSGKIKFYESLGFPTLHFKKDVGKLEAGTVIYFHKKVDIIRGFPKIRRTLLLSPTIEKHFKDFVAVEEKMNGYNVRIAKVGEKIVALTRGGFTCPFTTNKVMELLNLEDFFNDFPDLIVCGEMIGTHNPYVPHYYPEVGKLGFRIFDIRRKVSNEALSVYEKNKLLKKYNLPGVRLFGIFDVEEAPKKIEEIIKELEKENREGVVIKDPEMKIPPIKYTCGRAHHSELKFAFTFPFDFGRHFLFSRVIREGFQSYEFKESREEMRERAKRIGESILLPMIETIKKIAENGVAHEDVIIDVETKAEAEKLIRHLRKQGVIAKLVSYKDGKAKIRRIYQSTTDKIKHYLNGGLY